MPIFERWKKLPIEAQAIVFALGFMATALVLTMLIDAAIVPREFCDPRCIIVGPP